jgi:two-component system sensor histidine kinase EvgS
MMQSFKLHQHCFIVKSNKDSIFRHASHLIKTVFPSLLLISLLFLLLSTSTGMATPDRISKDTPLLIGGNKDFAPFEFLNSEGMPDGFTIDLMKAVAREEGLNLKFNLGIWSDARSDLKDGKIDALAGMLYSEERDKIFDFSVPYLIVPYMVFIRKGTPITEMKDLIGKEIIVVEDVHAHDWLTKNRITDSIITVKEATDVLKLLASGKHYCAVLPRLHGLDLLKDLEINHIETFGPPVLEKHLCFAVAHGSSHLLAELNEGLFAVQHSGEYDEIYLKWFSVHEQKKRFGQLINYVFPVIGAIILLLFSFIFWNWSLKRKVAQKTEELGQNEARLNQIVERIPIPTYVIDEARTVTHWNKACELLTGVTSDTIIGTKNYCSAFFDNRTYSTVDLLIDNILKKRIQQYENRKYRESAIVQGAYEAEYYLKNIDANGKWLHVTAALLKDQSGKINGAIETWQDLTEYKQLEKQLIQSQKMEAIGTLAAGIAHDFNNILLAVIGYAEVALMDIPNDSPNHDHLNQILSAGMRAKKLVNQILTFSRQTEVSPKPVQMSVIVKETLKLISASLPPAIKVKQDIQSEALVMADATQLHQVVMNLFTNAGHAMSEAGGILKIGVSEVQLDSNQIGVDDDLIPGKYIKLTVEDTGHGIPAEVRDNVFNPFFTTKKRGGAPEWGSPSPTEL